MNTFLFGLALVAGAPALKAPAKSESPILGLWSLTEWYINGQQVGVADGSTTEFLPEGKRLLTQGRGQAADERGYKLHAKTSPAAIDYIRPSDGAQPDIFLGIYKVDGDTLTITLGNMGNERPKNFEPDKDGNWTVMKFKRVKKE